MPVAGSSKRDACKTEACAIQDCLAQNSYDMNKCKSKVDKLKDCCSQNLKQSVHCGLVDSRTDTDLRNQMTRYDTADRASWANHTAVRSTVIYSSRHLVLVQLLDTSISGCRPSVLTLEHHQEEPRSRHDQSRRTIIRTSPWLNLISFSSLPYDGCLQFQTSILNMSDVPQHRWQLQQRHILASLAQQT